MSTNIKTITGLQNLPNLQTFEADYTSLVTVDFSGLTHLTNIDISDCFDGDTSDDTLTSFNVTGCTALEELLVDDSNFSAGFPDLSSCTSLQYFDADQCNLEGSLDLSKIPALRGFDLSDNSDLTEVIISSTQPLGNGRSVSLGGCESLTQTALDNILQQLSSGSISNGYVNFGNTTIPSLNRGVSAFRTLVVDKGWDYDKDGYSESRTATELYETAGEACTALGNNETGNLYVYTGTNIEVGNYVFYDANLLYPVSGSGFIAIAGDGSWSYQISGSNGLIVSQSACGV
jgi:hypothetical protein